MKDLEKKVLKHLQDRGWDKLKPSDISKSIMIEGAELLELFQWENRELEEVRQDEEKVDKIRGELADVMIYCIELAVLLNFDVTSLINDKLEIVAKKYPAELMKKIANGGAGSGADSEYWRIKKEYRRKAN